MFGMVHSVVAGARMHEDRQTVPVKSDPLSEVAELLGPYSELAAAARMRADWHDVEASDRYFKAGPSSFREALSPIQLIGIEIDVRVEIADAVLGHDRHLAERRESAKLGFPWPERRL
jgi:hypothetical protein